VPEVSRTSDCNPAVLSGVNAGGGGGGGSLDPNVSPISDGPGAGTGAGGGTCARRGAVWESDRGGGNMRPASGWGAAAVWCARARRRGRTVTASGSRGCSDDCEGNAADCSTAWCAWRTSDPWRTGVAGAHRTAAPGSGGAVGSKSTRSGNGSAATAWGTTSARGFSVPASGGGVVKSAGRGPRGAAGYRRPPTSLVADRREPSLPPGGVRRTS